MLRRTFLNGLAFLPVLSGFKKPTEEIKQAEETLLEVKYKKRIFFINPVTKRIIKEYKDGNFYWYDEKFRLHREDGPAEQNGNNNTEQYYCHGKRRDGRSVIYLNHDTCSIIPIHPLGHQNRWDETVKVKAQWYIDGEIEKVEDWDGNFYKYNLDYARCCWEKI